MKNKGIERRKHKRFPTISLIKEILISSAALNLRDSLPAIMFNLSSGGIAIITFIRLPLNSTVILRFNLNGIKLNNVEGKIVRVEGKRKIYLIAISFSKINKKVADRIGRIADEFDLCETKLLLGEKHVCTKKCSYYHLCSKNIKTK